MKRAIRVLSLLLAVTALLGACGTPANTPGDTGSAASNATDKPADPAAKDDPQASTAEPFRFTAVMQTRGVDDSTSIAGKAWLEKCSEILGRPIEPTWNFIPAADYDDKAKILLSSGDIPDYIQLPFLFDYKEMAGEGYFLDLAKYNMTNYLSYVDQAHQGRETAIMPDGSIPVVIQVILPTVEADKTPIFQNNAVWNYTAFEREGIPIPTTMDEVYEAAKAFKQKYPNSFPINSEYAGVFAVFYALHTNANLDGAATLFWNGTEFTFAGLEPNYKRGVELLRKWVAEGLFDPEYIIDTPDTIKTKMINEDNFMLLNAWRTHATEFTRDANYETTFVAAFIPDIPDVGKAWQTFSRANDVELLTWTIHAVSADTKEPETMAKLIDMQFLPEVIEIASWGVKDVTYTVQPDGSKKFVDEFFEGDDPSKVADKYGLWNDRSGRAAPGLRLTQDNMAREISFPLNDYTYFGGTYEEAPMQYTTYFKNLPWPNEYIPPMYDQPNVSMTPEDAATCSAILTEMKTYTSEMQAKFISGEESMDNWDAYIDTFKTAYDYQKVLDIYNRYAQEFLAK